MHESRDVDLGAGGLLHRFGAPVGADIGETGRGVGQQTSEQHRDAVESVVFGGEHIRGADSVPVERGVQDGFHEVAVRHVVGPLPLSLESGQDRVMPHAFFNEAVFAQIFIADHQVARDHRHLHGVFESLFRALFGKTLLAVVDVFADLAVLVGPGDRLLVFGRIVNVLVDAADDLGHIDRFAAHAEMFFIEIGLEDGAGDAHGDRTDGQIGFAAHLGGGDAGAGETQDLFGDVVGDLLFIGVLDVVTVNAERGQALLGMRGEHGGQIDGAGTFRAVEAPDRLDGMRIHVHGLGTIAPAGGHGERDSDIFEVEFIGAGRGFRHAADRGVGDHALDRSPVRITQIFGDQIRGGFRHVHGLNFQ